MFLTLPSYALNNKIAVESLNSFSASDFNSEFEVKVLEGNSFDNGVVIENGSIIKGQAVEIVDAKRGKRDAYIVLKPISYTVPSKGTIKEFEDADWLADVIGYKPFDAKSVAMSAGTTVAGYFIKGIGQVFYFAKGVISPQEGENRLKSGAISVYENSPLSLIEEGENINIKKGDLLVLRFYYSDVPKWNYFKRNK